MIEHNHISQICAITCYFQKKKFHIATYMDNDIAGQPQALQKSGRPVSRKESVYLMNYVLTAYLCRSLNLSERV